MDKGEIIRSLLLSGKSYSDIRKEVGCSKATISYHADRLGLKKHCRPKYDWNYVQELIDDGYTVKEICDVTGMSSSSYSKAVNRKVIFPRKNKCDYTIDEILENFVNKRMSSYDRKLVRRIFFKEGRTKCEGCGIDNWHGKRITLELDHIDGNPKNNVVENFRLLCPNCHSVTDTWRGRNIGK